MTRTTRNSNPISPNTAALVALEIALPSGLVAVLVFDLVVLVGGGDFLNDPVGLTGWLALCCLASGGAAWMITSLGNRRRVNRPIRIVLLAMLTKVLGVLLMPIVMAIWSAPSAMSGGAMPCFHIDNTCQAGLYGLDAVGGLFAAAASWYFLGLFVLIPGLADAILLVPEAIWDKVILVRTASPAYQTSV